jgi:hypothetical protein
MGDLYLGDLDLDFDDFEDFDSWDLDFEDFDFGDLDFGDLDLDFLLSLSSCFEIIFFKYSFATESSCSSESLVSE